MTHRVLKASGLIVAGWAAALVTGVVAAAVVHGSEVFVAGFVTAPFVLPSIVLFAVLSFWTSHPWAKHVGFVLPSLIIEGFFAYGAWFDPQPSADASDQ